MTLEEITAIEKGLAGVTHKATAHRTSLRFEEDGYEVGGVDLAFCGLSHAAALNLAAHITRCNPAAMAELCRLARLGLQWEAATAEMKQAYDAYQASRKKP